MNIEQAKKQIKNAIEAYRTKDESGEYLIPSNQQRPVFLMGPPGIGKTAIIEQIATELDIAVLSYSMTHHTRQSALGLPFIVHKSYDNGEMECDVSEYTMSEIISAIYDIMEETGKKEGILFLDEINCVSETLAPVMLQFLQYKVFGRHKVPDGWIIVTAGNPPEYNNSVREFDIVTWDRLKRVDIEPDFKVWKKYAVSEHIHPAVLTYLESKQNDFYKIESTVDGKSFVTARGWEDLSRMMRVYELKNIKIDKMLISQYIQNKKIAQSFAMYYDLFKKYKSDYSVDEILSGKADDTIKERAIKAQFDERLALIGLMLDVIRTDTEAAMIKNDAISMLMDDLKKFKANKPSKKNSKTLLNALANKHETNIKNAKTAGSLSRRRQQSENITTESLYEISGQIQKTDEEVDVFEIAKSIFKKKVSEFKIFVTKTQNKIKNMYKFSDKVFGDGQEKVIITTELTAGNYTAEFINNFGSDEYFKNNKELLLYDRAKELKKEIFALEL